MTTGYERDMFHDISQIRAEVTKQTRALERIASALENLALRDDPLPPEDDGFFVKTASNPSGEVRQCDRKDLHGPHEYQPQFGAYFNVYCPGNDGGKS